MKSKAMTGGGCLVGFLICLFLLFLMEEDGTHKINSEQKCSTNNGKIYHKSLKHLDPIADCQFQSCFL